MCFKKEKIIIVIFALFSFLNSEGKELDLQKQLNTAQSRIDSIDLLIELSEHYRFTLPEKGLKYARTALTLSLSIDDTILMIQSANKLAILEKENSISTTALGTIIQALSWAKEIKNDDLIASSQLITGHIYSSLDESIQAIEYYTKCLLYFKHNNDSSAASYTYSGLGIVYYDNHQYDESLTNYLNAEDYWVDAESALKADLWNNIGALYVDLRDYKKAKHYYERALKHYETGELTSEISMVYYNLGELSLLQNNYEVAHHFYNKSLEIGQKIGSPTEMMWAFEGLYLTSKKELKYKEALKYHELYKHLKDSLDKVQNKKEVMEIESLFHQEEHLKKIKEQEIKIIQTEQKVDAEKFKNLIYISFSVLIFSIFIFGLILYLKSRKLGRILLEQKITITHTLKEKELLLKEIHHRVKNNLQVISSLLNLQRNAVDNPQAEYILNETQNRIRAIALVHQKLYQSHNIGKINLSSYLIELVDQQKAIFGDKLNPVKCVIDVPDKAEFNIDVAISLGLIVSELITNSFKYAFAGNKDNVLTLKLQEKETACYHLIIADNGKGLPKEYENKKKESLGLDLVRILVEQINGTLNYKKDNGAIFTISFNS